MTKILATIGPVSAKKGLKKFTEKTDIIRLNMSHNTFEWHKNIIKKIKYFNKEKLILVDIPGVKPRTLNKKLLRIRKGEIVSFGYKQKSNKIISLSNPLPKITSKPKKFSLSDGAFEFKFISLKKNILTGISYQNFILKNKKGLNIPGAIYDDILQEKIYLNFLKKIQNLSFDCVGLSFIQNSKILKLLKKKFPNKFFISKLENSLGYLNRKEIIDLSDSIMIDRGDLSAEVGITNLSNYSEDIIQDCKLMGKPVIIATENLNSLIHDKIPTKSEIINIDYYLSKKIDYIMLSDETATSKHFMNTLNWLNQYLKQKIKYFKNNNIPKLTSLLEGCENQIIIIFSKKGYIFENIKHYRYKKIFLFTENIKLMKSSKLLANVNSFLIKYPKNSLDTFFYKNIKKNYKVIFEESKKAILVNVIFPRRNSRANSISLIDKDDFIK